MTLREILGSLRDFVGRQRLDAELDDELRFHRDMLERDARVAGDPAASARTRLGNETRIKEDTRAMWSFAWLESVMQDVRFAIRTYIREPGFTAVVLVTLALGIGANTAVFSAVDAILLRSLPFPNAERLVAVWPHRTFSAAEYDFMREHARSYEGGAALFSPGWGSVLTQPDVATQLTGARTSVNFFSVLGARPLIGRTFNEGESSPATAKVLLLSWSLWQTRFGADSGVLAKTITLDGSPVTVVGVMPRDFSIFQAGADYWMPLEIDPSSSFYKGATAFMVGRLASGVTEDGALAELRTLAPQMRQAFAFEDNYGDDVGMSSLQDSIVTGVRKALLVVFGAVGFLVLIATANVANLLVARASARRHEIALRGALGASRSRVIRQLVAESLVLAAGGGILGCLVGAAGVRALKSILPAGVPRADAIALDVRVLAVSALITIGVGFLFGLAPALIASRESAPSLGGARGVGTSSLGRRLRNALVVAEVALALVLVIGAGLMSQSMWRLTHVDSGFKTDHVVTLRVQVSGPAFPTGASRLQFYDAALGAVRSTPGVVAAGAIQHLPLSGFDWHRDVEVDGHPAAVGAAPFRPGFRTITGDYFEAMRIPVVRGRTFAVTDDSSVADVALVNETFAKKAFPGEDPIGKRIKPQRFGWATIIGVVRDVRHVSLSTPPLPEFFISARQHLQSQMQIVVRTSSEPTALARTIYDRVAAINRAVPVSNLRTLEAHSYASVAQPRAVFYLMVAFAVVGLALGAIGIYGVVAYTVANRSREIGIRVALGASRGSVLAMLMREGALNATAGIAIGITAAVALSGVMRTLVFEVSPTNALTYAAVSAGLLGVALVASWLPARRAVRADQVSALRAD